MVVPGVTLVTTTCATALEHGLKVALSATVISDRQRIATPTVAAGNTSQRNLNSREGD